MPVSRLSRIAQKLWAFSIDLSISTARGRIGPKFMSPVNSVTTVSLRASTHVLSCIHLSKVMHFIFVVHNGGMSIIAARGVHDRK
jgi:hypothetical protein